VKRRVVAATGRMLTSQHVTTTLSFDIILKAQKKSLCERIYTHCVCMCVLVVEREESSNMTTFEFEKNLGTKLVRLLSLLICCENNN
jgi:hypothetical protein